MEMISEGQRGATGSASKQKLLTVVEPLVEQSQHRQSITQ